MTCHRFLRSEPDVLVRCVADRHAGVWFGATATQARWFSGASPSRVVTLSWRSRSPAGPLDSCLEIERGACGVIVHLTVVPTGRMGRRRLMSKVMSLWAMRELTVLAQLAESEEAERWAA